MKENSSEQINADGESVVKTQWDEMVDFLERGSNDSENEQGPDGELDNSDDVVTDSENSDDLEVTVDEKSGEDDGENTSSDVVEEENVAEQDVSAGEKEKTPINLNLLKNLNNLTLYGLAESEKLREKLGIQDNVAVELARDEVKRRKQEGTFVPDASEKFDFNDEFYVHNGNPKVVDRYRHGHKLRDVFVYEENRIQPSKFGGFGMYDDNGEWNWVEYEELDKKGKVFRRSDNESLVDVLEKNCREEIKADLDNAEEIIGNAKLDEERKSRLLDYAYSHRYDGYKEKIEADLDNAEEIIGNAKLDKKRKSRLLNYVHNKRLEGYKEEIKADLDNAEEMIENAKLDEERKSELLNCMYNKRFEGYKEKIEANLDNAEEIIGNAKLNEGEKSRLLNYANDKRYETCEKEIKADLDNAEEIIEDAKLDEEKKKRLLNFVYDKRLNKYKKQIKANIDNAEEIIENANIDESHKERLKKEFYIIFYRKNIGKFKELLPDFANDKIEDMDFNKIPEEYREEYKKLCEGRAQQVINDYDYSSVKRLVSYYPSYSTRSWYYNGREYWSDYVDSWNAPEIRQYKNEVYKNAMFNALRRESYEYTGDTESLLCLIDKEQLNSFLMNLEAVDYDEREKMIANGELNGRGIVERAREQFSYNVIHGSSANDADWNDYVEDDNERIAKFILGREPREFVEWLAEEREKQDRGGKARFTRFCNSSETFKQCRDIVDEENKQKREEMGAIEKIRNDGKRMIWKAATFNEVRGMLDEWRKAIAEEYDKEGAIEVESMKPGNWKLIEKESDHRSRKKEMPLEFGIRKVEAVTNLANTISEANPNTNVQFVKGTFPRENKDGSSASERYEDAFMRAAGTYLGFMFDYNGQKCVMAESFADDAATYLYRCPTDQDPLEYFTLTKQENYQLNPNCAVVDHLAKENIGVSISEIQQKALRFFTENLVDENGNVVLDGNGNPLPDKKIVFYKSEGGRNRWEESFGAKYQYELPDLKEKYSAEEIRELRRVILKSRQQLNDYEKWLENHDSFNG